MMQMSKFREDVTQDFETGQVLAAVGRPEMSRSWEMDDGIRHQLECWEEEGRTDWHAMDEIIQKAVDAMQDDEYEFYHREPFASRRSDQ